MQLTNEQRRRVTQSLTETCQLLEREMGYSAHLQNAERIAFYRSHISKLEAMLA